MRDDELLAIYGATRQLAESMAARDAELKQSTAALEAIIVQVHKLPAMLGAQTSKYIAASIREVVQGDFKEPVEKAVEGPIRSIEMAAYHEREAVEQIKRDARFQNWTVFGLIPALGMALGGGWAYYFFARLREQMRRLFAARITFQQTFDEDGKHGERWRNMDVARKASCGGT